MNKKINPDHFNLQEYPFETDKSSMVLFSKGQAEIFTDVLRVRYLGSANSIHIEHGEEGSFTASTRGLEEVYYVYCKGPLFEEVKEVSNG